MVGCEKNPSESTVSITTKQMALLDEIETGMVRQLVFESLYNHGVNTCLDGSDNITMEVFGRSDAFDTLQSWAAFNDVSELNTPLSSYVEELLNDGYNNAVFIQTPGDGNFIYLLNDGTFGIDLPETSTDLRNAGILIPLTPRNLENQESWTITCTSQEGSYGTGCTCTTRTIVVVCEEGQECACPGGGQCEGSCNRTTDWTLCDNAEIFLDEVPFMDWNNGDYLHGEHL